MGIDVQLVTWSGYVGARPKSWAMYEWLDVHMQNFNIRYGWVDLTQADVEELATKYADDPVAEMLLERVDAMEALKAKSLIPDGPYEIELMVSM